MYVCVTHDALYTCTCTCTLYLVKEANIIQRLSQFMYGCGTCVWTHSWTTAVIKQFVYWCGNCGNCSN